MDKMLQWQWYHEQKFGCGPNFIALKGFNVGFILVIIATSNYVVLYFRGIYNSCSYKLHKPCYKRWLRRIIKPKVVESLHFVLKWNCRYYSFNEWANYEIENTIYDPTYNHFHYHQIRNNYNKMKQHDDTYDTREH